MPKYNSKTQSKNGGRRRKQTKRKMRRGRKSRKVMRGGAIDAELLNTIKETIQKDETLMTELGMNMANAFNPSFDLESQLKNKYTALSPSSKLKLKNIGYTAP